MYIPKIYAIFCTRSEKLSETTQRLVEFYRECSITPMAIIGAKSIFGGYKHALEAAKPNPEDIIILCHDDITHLMQPKDFLNVLVSETSKPAAGFIGPAGTTYLSEDAVWWNHQVWQQQKHSGLVFHGSLGTDNFQNTYYGQYREVLVLDGLFLACKYKVLESISISKPDYFEGEWDFYDIYFTWQANWQGLKNAAVPIIMSHESFGNLAGRDSWHKNRLAFLKVYGANLPKEIGNNHGVLRNLGSSKLRSDDDSDPKQTLLCESSYDKELFSPEGF